MIVILFLIVVKWKILSLFEFKGDIRNFFFLFIFWNLTKTINRGFYSRFNDIWNYIDSNIFFFRILGFRGIRHFFLVGGFCFWGNHGWRENRTDIHPIGFRLLMGRRQRKQFYRRIRRPMKLLRAYFASIFFF